jgi:hypothetical protein
LRGSEHIYIYSEFWTFKVNKFTSIAQIVLQGMTNNSRFTFGAGVFSVLFRGKVESKEAAV